MSSMVLSATELLSRDGFIIRRYRPEDRQAIRNICVSASWMGRVLPGMLPDGWIWAEFWTRYHTDVQPELSYAVESPQGNVVGYLTGATDQREVDRYDLRLLPGIVWHVIRHRLMRRRDSRRACLSFLRTLLAGDLGCSKEILREYPACMHINLSPEARGHGLGRAMMELFMADLRARGVTGIHGQCMSINAAAGKSLVSTGFQFVSSRPTRAFRHVAPERIEVQTWVRLL